MKFLPCFLHFPSDPQLCESLLQYRCGLITLAGIEYWPMLYYQMNKVQILLFERLNLPESTYYYRLQESELAGEENLFDSESILVANAIASEGDPFLNQELPWYGLFYVKGWQALTEIQQQECFVSVLGNQVQCHGGVVQNGFKNIRVCHDEFFIITRAEAHNVVSFEERKREKPLPQNDKNVEAGSGKLLPFGRKKGR